MIPTLLILSIVGGLFAGVVGLGGAVIMIPLMLAVPPLIGVGQLTIKEVAGISMVQVLAASVSGCLAHIRGGNVHVRTLLTIGIPLSAASLAGALLSQYMDGRTILTLFGILVGAAFLLLVCRRGAVNFEGNVDQVEFSPVRSLIVGGFVGLVSGIVGAGGGFMLVPLMISVLGIPVRVTVGSSLGIIVLGALMGSIGKVLSAQIPWAYLAPVLLGSIPAAQVGARLSRHIPPAQIRRILIGLILVSLAKTWWDVYLAWTAPH